MPHMRPEASVRNFTTFPRTSIPNAALSMTTHLEKDRGTVSPFGLINALPKSTVIPMRFLPATARVVPQMREKSGAIRGIAAFRTLSLLKVKAHPSTEPSGMFTVGPVIAIVHVFAVGVAWKYPQYR